MRLMPLDDLDEVDFYLLDLIEYVAHWGVTGRQARDLLQERIAVACAITDDTAELALEAVSGPLRTYH